MSYYLAPSLVALRDEVNVRWPNRDKLSDGWIGDTSHNARKSDHNPDWSAGGVVRAIDIDKDGIDVAAVLDAVVGDDRVWYVIWNYHIYSRTYGWTKRRYYGSNPHDKHIHISIQHSRWAESSTMRWLGTAAPTQEDDDMTEAQWKEIQRRFDVLEAEIKLTRAQQGNQNINRILPKVKQILRNDRKK